MVAGNRIEKDGNEQDAKRDIQRRAVLCDVKYLGHTQIFRVNGKRSSLGLIVWINKIEVSVNGRYNGAFNQQGYRRQRANVIQMPHTHHYRDAQRRHYQ